MIFGAIVAGGTGTRMKIEGAVSFKASLPDIPKQFLPIKDKPIIYYSIKKFLEVSKIDRVIVGVHKDYYDYMNEIIDAHFYNRKDDILVVIGGNDRNRTLMNMIDAINSKFGSYDDDIIVTHDAVRPFVTAKMIEENISLAMKYGAVDTAYSTTDTVVVSENGEYIEAVPNRASLYNGQTPQSFNMKKLKQLYSSLTDEQKLTLTDACKIFTLNNEKVYLAKGDAINMKITAKSDYFTALALAEYLL